ncbi:MAG: FUSC family protein [Tangfeifania sp.]
MLIELKKTIENNKKDILRLSLRSAVAAVVTYAVISQIRPGEAFLSILAAVLILDFHTGSTLTAARNRVMSTLLGIILSVLTVWLLPHGWGTAASLALTMLVINAIAAVKSEWRYGVVAAISIALGAEANVIENSADRIIAISTGAGIGVLVSFLVMPHKAEVRAKNYMRKAVMAMNERFTIVMHNTWSDEGKSPEKARKNFYSNMGSARSAAKYIKFYNAENIRNALDAIEKVYISVIMVDRISAKTKTEIGGEMSGIRNNIRKFMQTVNHILDKVSKSEFDNDAGFNDLGNAISDIKSDIKFAQNNTGVLNMQHTFLFAIDEIRDNLKITNDFFKKA